MRTRFNANEANLNKLVMDLDSNKITDSLFSEEEVTRKATEFNPTISDRLTLLGLEEVSLLYGSCKNPSPKTFIFKTNWITRDSIFLAYDICDTSETSKGFYKKDKNENEIWGLGKSWMMIKIVKYLDHKQ
jgi:hypothetical protein